MIDEQKDTSEQSSPQEELVLSVSADRPSGPSPAVQKAPMALPHFPLLASSSAFLSPLAKLRYLWRHDPAYKVVMIVAAILLIAGLIFGTLATNILFQMSELFLRNGRFVALSQPSPTEVTPQGTVDFHPIFPTPGGGQGSTGSSQPPMESTPSLQDTPAITPTLPPTPTPIQQGGQLTVQITSIPTQVSNNSIVPVQVTTNEPDVFVQLYVSYNVPPGFYSSRTEVTDGNGNATLSWIVNVFSIDKRRAVAHIVAIGQDQNGQRVSSSVFTVEII